MMMVDYRQEILGMALTNLAEQRTVEELSTFELLLLLRHHRCTLRAEGDRLIVNPRQRIPAALYPAITAHKRALLAWLDVEAEEAAAGCPTTLAQYRGIESPGVV